MAHTPLPYRSYQALVTQSGTSAPTVDVRQNTLGTTVSWTRTGVGLYKMTAADPVFTSGKTAIIISSPKLPLVSVSENGAGASTTVRIIQTFVSSVVATVLTAVATDGLMNSMLVEIRVYY